MNFRVIIINQIIKLWKGVCVTQTNRWKAKAHEVLCERWLERGKR